MNFWITRFDVSGRYLGQGMITQESLDLEDNREMVYLGKANLATQYHDLETGLPVDMGPRPSKFHLFDYASKTWADPRTLSDLQATKWAEIKASRVASEAGGFLVNGVGYDSSEPSVTRISGAVQMAMIANAAGQPFSIDWTLADNTVASLNAAQMISVGLALGTHISTQHEKARLLRVRIEAALDAAALEAIQWE